MIIKEREPIAQNLYGQRHILFILTAAGKRLPLSNDYTAHVPVFTSFTSDNKKLSHPDSLLLNDIRKIALFIQQDSFWNAQVSQVNITPQSRFDIIPVVGNQVLKIGKADSLDSKFSRLYAFYKQVWTKTGFEKYETVSVEFSGQVVATKRGMLKPEIDSALSLRIVNAMRAGVDILKDSSLLIRTVVAMQKKLPDSTLSQSKTGLSIAANLHNSNNETKQNTTIKNNTSVPGNKSKKTPKAVMPKSKQKQ